MAYSPTEGVAIVSAAYFAAEKHRDQRRKSDDSPYINHPLGVADILWHVGTVIDQNVLAAAILHDTVEDTNTTLDEIARIFGPHVSHIVAEVTDNKKLPKHERKMQQIYRASDLSEEATLVKLADKLYNLRDLLRVKSTGIIEAIVL